MIVSVLGLVLPWLVLAVGCWVGYQIVAQNGRILLRLEALEHQLAQLMALAQGAPGQAPPADLPLGQPAPEFELPDLSGERRRLAEFRGRRVLLVFFNPACGYCSQMAPALAALRGDGRSGGPLPVLVSAGDAEANRRLVADHGIRHPLLLQEHGEVAAAYHATGTPTGYLVDEAGRIASGLAAGAAALLTLARDDERAGAAADASPTNGNGRALPGARSLAASKIAREGLKAGTTAPHFRLPRVDGGELALADYRGRQLLLVFSDPHCGPCQQLAPRLEQLHRERRVEVLMVSRGDVQENQRKVDELGLTFPVALQKQWEVSREYAMFATPVGYLVDERGVLAADAASGEDAILRLAAGARPSPQRREELHMVP